MSMSAVPEIPLKPVHRIAKELMASSGFLLAKLGMDFKARAVDRLDEAGYEVYDYSLLAILAEGAHQAQATIAETVGLDPSRLVALLDSLEERGLIVRERDPHDRRRHVVSITATGKRELARLREMVRKLEDEYLSCLDAESRKALHGVLQKLAVEHDPRCGPAAD
jgi:MarR family transcriptional regulator, lower aerobic nicotinate degradation pathway regulator